MEAVPFHSISERGLSVLVGEIRLVEWALDAPTIRIARQVAELQATGDAAVA